MIDLDELIARAEKLLAENQWTSGWGVEALAEELCDALESVRAERDAALARIAEIEVERDEWRTEHGIVKERSSTRFQAYQQKKRELRAMEIERDKAEARIAEAAKLHRNAGPSQGYDSRFKGGYGMLGDCCATCGSHGEYGVEWPCPTAVSLGLNEGEKDES